MDFIQLLRENADLSDLLCDVCDVEILPAFQTPEDEDGHLVYNLPGRTFAREGSGSEYILLEDGSVGYWGSEGACGRIAEDLGAFFEFMIHCPCWKDYLDAEEYQDAEELREFAQEVFEEYEENCREDGFDLRAAQRELADSLGIEMQADAAEILMRFYRCAVREPRLVGTYTEKDGSVHSGTGSVFDR